MCTFVIGCRVLGRGVRRLQGRGEAARRQGRVPGHPGVQASRAGDRLRADHVEEPGGYRALPDRRRRICRAGERRVRRRRSPSSRSPATPPRAEGRVRDLRQREGRPVRGPGHRQGARRQGQGHGHPQHPVQPQLRSTTFVETIKTEFPGIEVVADVLTQQDNQKAYTAVMQTAQKYPDLGAVFSPEGPSGRGAAQAAVELGGEDQGPHAATWTRRSSR